MTGKRNQDKIKKTKEYYKKYYYDRRQRLKYLLQKPKTELTRDEVLDLDKLYNAYIAKTSFQRDTVSYKKCLEVRKEKIMIDFN